MSWLARLLSPSKRRASEEQLPPQKRARSQLQDNLFGTKFNTKNQFEGQGLKAFGSAAGLGSLLTSSLVPRPLALIASLDHSNNLTVAPSTSCTVVSEAPAYISVALSKVSLPADSLTDAVSSVIDSKEFTVNIVSEWLVEAATQIAGSYKHFKPETKADLAATGIITEASEQVAVPRIAQAAVSLECRMKNKVVIKDEDGEVASVVVVAEVVCIVAKEGLLETSNGLTTISASKLQPVAVVGRETGARIADQYSLPLEPQDSVADPIPPAGPDAIIEESVPAAAIEELEVTRVNQDVAVAVATAVAESLANEPDAPALEEVNIVLKDTSEVPPTRSTRSTRSATAKSREATPISVVVQGLK